MTSPFRSTAADGEISGRGGFKQPVDPNDPLSGYKEGGTNAGAYDVTGIDTRIRYDSSRNPPFTVMTSMPYEPQQSAEEGQHHMSVDRHSWDTAVRHLYRDAVAYIATGPRRHEDWTLDVLALMARSVPDPRGWTRVDDAEKEPERVGNPTWPFAIRPPEYVAPRLKEIDRDSAENLILALTEGGCTLSNLQYFDESVNELRAMARTILARYGDDAAYRTNVSKRCSAPGTLDFTLESLEYSPMSVFTEDCGLVVVSDTEVGLFWTFNDL
ncbi:hypothetical protein NFX46_11730 [Streptomyces phaeoluteigriseus]|uniref:Uncharacterized protein n=1 Tax=Streptomyces phaeoluteigriseus TaxID=114686 RepID=A0ABY4Z6U5_9ACTN|nr:hypothetical protein [Streptomyces phaeoluteigriseus]USQ84405.1 hypothetical protein NFX46_11730 [Streptomyces phaeoluteigriseus]